MSNSATPGENPDRSTLRKASLKVALRISAACAVMVLGLLAATALYLMNQLAHPEVPGAAAGTAYAYLDSKDVLEAMVIAGVAGIVLAGIVGWLSARSAIRPLGDALARQRRFVQDASHELRTPLTILDTRIQLAQRNTVPDSRQGQDLARIREDAATLTGIVNELLLAATADAPDRSVAPADLADAAAGVAESLQLVADQRDVRLDFSADARPLARIDANALRRAVLALADNALAHTPPGGRVSIRTSIEQTARSSPWRTRGPESPAWIRPGSLTASCGPPLPADHRDSGASASAWPWSGRSPSLRGAPSRWPRPVPREPS